MPLTVLAHGDGLCGSGAAVIDGCVGHIHTGEHADHGLELKDGLENTLADLCLVRGVGGDQLLAGDHALNNSGNKMTVGTGTPEDGGVDPVFLRHGGNSPADLQLAEALGKVQVITYQHIPGDAGKEVLDALHAHGGKHLPALFAGIGDIASHRGSFLSPIVGERGVSAGRRWAAPRGKRLTAG